MPRDTSKYVLDGVRLVSVTEALDDAGYIDLSRIPFDVLETARERGSGVHTWIELVTNHPDSIRGMDPPEVLAPYIAAWEKWRVESRFEIERAEQVVIDPTYRYAGTYDVSGRMNGCRALTDYKARYGLTPEIGPQLAAYVAAGRASGIFDPGEPIDRYSLLLRKDGSYRCEPHKNRYDLHAFRHAVGVTNWRIEHHLLRLDAMRRAA